MRSGRPHTIGVNRILAICILVATLLPGGAIRAEEKMTPQDAIELLTKRAQEGYHNFKDARPPRVVMSTWENSYKISHQIVFTDDSEGRLSAMSSQILRGGEAFHCNDFLVASQYYPLNKMLANKYISEEQMQTIIRLGDKLNPAQFRFFEFIKDVKTPDDGIGISLENGETSFGTIIWMNGERASKVAGSLWTVAAQYTTTHVNKQLAKMPWQFDEAYAHVMIDREKYKLGWEMGRAAQDVAGAHMDLVSLAALGMLRETLIRGGAVDDSYVFVHSLGAAQNRLFKSSKTPSDGRRVFNVFHSNTENTDEVLVANLKDLLETLPPEKIYKPIHNVIEASGNKLSVEGAIEHMMASESITRQDVDVVAPSLGAIKTPVTLSNATLDREVFINFISLKHDVVKEMPLFYPTISASFVDPYLDDAFATDEDPNIGALVKDSLFGISNLDPSIAAKNSDYVKLMLMSAFYYYGNAVHKVAPHVTRLVMSRVKFAVTQQDKEIKQQANAIAGGQTVHVSWSNTRMKIMTDGQGHGQMTPRVNAQLANVQTFDSNAIFKLIEENPQLAREARMAFRLKNSQIMQLLRGWF